MWGDRRRNPKDVPKPPPGMHINFIALDGTPSVKDSDDVVTPSATLDGNSQGFSEQGSPPSTAVNELRVFAVREEGELVLKVRDESDGAILPLGGGGGAAMAILWDSGPGDPFGDGQTATVTEGETVVMVDVELLETVTIAFPPAGDNAGKRVVIVNIHDKIKDGSPGTLVFDPDGTDNIGSGAAGATRRPYGQSYENHIFVSDGASGWHSVGFGGTYMTYPYP